MGWIAEQLLGNAIFAALQWWLAKMVSGIAFFRNRRHLISGVPFSSLLKDTSSVWAVWIAGNDARHITPLAQKLRRLILPSPSTPWLRDIRVGGTTQATAYQTTLNEIRKAIEYAQDWRKSQEKDRQGNEDILEIRWSRNVLPNSMMIGIPDGLEWEWYQQIFHERGWVQVDLAMNFIERGQRPTVYISGNRRPDLFEEYKKAFENLWDKARKIPDEPFKPYDIAEKLWKEMNNLGWRREDSNENSSLLLNREQEVERIENEVKLFLLNYCVANLIRPIIIENGQASGLEWNNVKYILQNPDRYLMDKYL